MSYSDLGNEDRIELENLRKLLYRAVMELACIHEFDGTELQNLITSAEGKAIVEEGMKLLGVPDLSYEELPIRLVRA